jgi:hypothetical protein
MLRTMRSSPDTANIWCDVSFPKSIETLTVETLSALFLCKIWQSSAERRLIRPKINSSMDESWTMHICISVFYRLGGSFHACFDRICNCLDTTSVFKLWTWTPAVWKSAVDHFHSVTWLARNDAKLIFRGIPQIYHSSLIFCVILNFFEFTCRSIEADCCLKMCANFYVFYIKLISYKIWVIHETRCRQTPTFQHDTALNGGNFAEFVTCGRAQ